jgi:hypothetical protein
MASLRRNNPAQIVAGQGGSSASLIACGKSR